MLKYVENNDLMFPDQDCLNVFFKGKTKLMPYTYNFQILGQFCIDLFDENDSAKFNEYLNQNKNPIIIHYINKPFRNANNVYFGEKYFYYRKKTFWKYTINESIRKRIIRLRISSNHCYLMLLGKVIFDKKL